MKASVAIIGGTGIGERLAQWPGRAIHVPTERGMMRGKLVEIDELPILVLQRHAAGHKTPPHLVPFEGMALGLQSLGVHWCLSSAAVGSLRQNLDVGSFAACTDMVDASARRTTLFQRGVRHIDMGRVFPAADVLKEAGATAEAVYINVNGPRYETPAEIRCFQAWGGDVVGMTAGSEAIAMREAGIGYGCLAIVTNMAAGLTANELAHHEVVDIMKTRGAQAVEVLLAAARILARG